VWCGIPLYWEKKNQLVLVVLIFKSHAFFWMVLLIWNFQVNVVSYKTRPAAKDFIQVEILVERNSQKIILIGKVSIIIGFTR
jgi:hypothetical protein